MLLQDSKIKNTSRSISWGFVNRVLYILSQFIVRTEIIYYLGVEYTGLDGLFKSVLSVLSLAELGFGSALVFSMYRPVVENDIEKICAYLNYYKKCYRIVGAIILGMGLFLTPFVPFLINDGYPNTINIYLLYAIYLLNTVLSYYMFAYKTSVLIATQRNDIISNISSIVLILTNVTQFLLLSIFKNFYLFVIVIPIMTIINNLIVLITTNRLFPDIKPIGKIDKEEKAKVFVKIKGLIAQRIGLIILTSADNVVISAMLGLRTLGIYSNYYYVINALFSFFLVIQNSLQPVIGNSIQTKSVNSNYEDFKFFHFLYILSLIFCTSCLLSIYQSFIKVWVGEKLMLEMPLVIMLVIYFYTHKMSDICSIYRYAAGMFEVWKFVPLIAGIFNLILNIILTRFIGLYGIVLSTILAMVIIYLPFYCYPIIINCFKDRKRFFVYIANQILYILLTVVVSVTVFFVASLIHMKGFVGLVLKTSCAVSLSGLIIIVLAIVSPYRDRLKEIINNTMKKS